MILLDLSYTDPKILSKIDEIKDIYICFNCRIKITEQSFLINMAGNRPFHTFTNPAGFSYNLLTFKFCESYRETTSPENRDTWFAGYDWIIINCAQCNNLLGWKYVKNNNNSDFFFGLIREQIVLI